MLKDKCCHCFKALSVPSRLRLFRYIKTQKKPVRVTQLASFIDLTQPTVSWHLNQLEKVGLISKIKKGREVMCQCLLKCQDCPLCQQV